MGFLGIWLIKFYYGYLLIGVCIIGLCLFLLEDGVCYLFKMFLEGFGVVKVIWFFYF